MVLVSSLYSGYDKIDELDNFIKNIGMENVGAEFTFKNDPDYIRKLEAILSNADYPFSFHGPLINTEAASVKGTREYDAFVENYIKTFESAKKFGVSHVVYHTSYKPYKPEDITQALEICIENTDKISTMARQAGVNLLIENLPVPPGGLQLISNENFFNLFKILPETNIIIDIGHANITGLDYEAFIKEYSNRVRAFHIHNNEGKADIHNSIFKGTFDFNRFKRVYKTYTRDRDIVLEYKPQSGLTYGDIRSHAAYVKKEILGLTDE